MVRLLYFCPKVLNLKGGIQHPFLLRSHYACVIWVNNETLLNSFPPFKLALIQKRRRQDGYYYWDQVINFVSPMKYWRKSCKWICKQLEQQTLKHVYLWEKEIEWVWTSLLVSVEFLHPDKSNVHMRFER